MAGYQAEKRPDINVLEMTVTGEKDKSPSLSLLMSRSVWRFYSAVRVMYWLVIYQIDLFILEMREKYI